MKLSALIGILSLVLAVGLEASSQAQMFGSRSLGASRRSSRSTADASDVGTVQGNERFVRGNREKSDFVGTNSQDSRSFVGSEQGTGAGRVRSSAADLRIERTRDANRAARSSRRSTPIYEPRLSLGFRYGGRQPEQLSSALQARLASSKTIQRTSPIEVSLEEATATLRGEVASQHDRRVAELLVLFEPGVSKVHNELRVKHSPPQVTAPPQAAADSKPPSR